ncbi:MAG: hypothetical protein CVT89_04575 [Candidatus Altiarchaeales archaeon HGW-Altiarchaeales-2]|nr:MAG: hypothetical protein CVT89_04575 [Candidatus Altiarchaeales archaeon HGW-Altiarchaeales-2]
MISEKGVVVKKVELEEMLEYSLNDICEKYGIKEEEFKKLFEEKRKEFALQAENRFRINSGGMLPF